MVINTNKIAHALVLLGEAGVSTRCLEKVGDTLLDDFDDLDDHDFEEMGFVIEDALAEAR